MARFFGFEGLFFVFVRGVLGDRAHDVILRASWCVCVSQGLYLWWRGASFEDKVLVLEE